MNKLSDHKYIAKCTWNSPSGNNIELIITTNNGNKRINKYFNELCKDGDEFELFEYLEKAEVTYKANLVYTLKGHIKTESDKHIPVSMKVYLEDGQANLCDDIEKTCLENKNNSRLEEVSNYLKYKSVEIGYIYNGLCFPDLESLKKLYHLNHIQ